MIQICSIAVVVLFVVAVVLVEVVVLVVVVVAVVLVVVVVVVVAVVLVVVVLVTISAANSFYFPLSSVMFSIKCERLVKCLRKQIFCPSCYKRVILALRV